MNCPKIPTKSSVKIAGQCLKGALLSQRPLLATERPLKKCFFFHLKSSFRFQDI